MIYLKPERMAKNNCDLLQKELPINNTMATAKIEIYSN
jgi:hypothetical protein